MKFYYNNKLMRTSKTHEYHFAIVSASDDCCSCHGTYEAALKEYRKAIAACESEIEFCKNCIKALEAGRTSIRVRERSGYSYIINFKKEGWDGKNLMEVSSWEADIERLQKKIENYKTRKIVELEAR